MLMLIAIIALSLAAGGFGGYQLSKHDATHAERRIALYRSWVKKLEADLHDAKEALVKQKPIVFGKGKDL